MRYPLGQPIFLSTTVKDRTGTPVNAGTLTLVVSNPDLTQQTFSSPTLDSTGNYHQDIPATALVLTGHYQYVWTSTGTGAGVAGGEFDIYDPFANAEIVSLSDVKTYLNIPAGDTVNDSELQAFIDAATPVIEDVVGPVTNRTFTEWFNGGSPTIVVRHPPILSVTSVIEYRGKNAIVLTAAASPDLATGQAYMFEPFGRITRLNGASGTAVVYLSSQGTFATFPFGPSSVQVVYTAGVATVPPNVQLAALEFIRHNWDLTQQGGRSGPAFGGGAMEDMAVTPSGFAMPRRVLEWLEGGTGRRPPAVA